MACAAGSIAIQTHSVFHFVRLGSPVAVVVKTVERYSSFAPVVIIRLALVNTVCILHFIF